MNENEAKGIVEKIKALVRKGNVSRIVVRRGTRELMNISVNTGLVGGAVTLLAAKWVLLAGVLATVGFGCTVEVIKDDGQVVDVLKEEDTKKARDYAAGVVETVKESVRGAVWQDDRASLEVIPEGDGFKVLISWGSSAWECTEWTYACDYDPDTDTLTAEHVICDDVKYDEAGEETRTNVLDQDCGTAFSLNGEGRAVIRGAGDDRLEGKTFEKIQDAAGDL